MLCCVIFCYINYLFMYLCVYITWTGKHMRMHTSMLIHAAAGARASTHLHSCHCATAQPEANANQALCILYMVQLA